MAKEERLFVGNLPENITEQDVKNEFSSYGNVQTIELKTKRDVDDPQKIINTFAFLTIQIDSRTLNQCINEFRDEKFRGRYLQVSVARENFLDKLKREREEAAAIASSVSKFGTNSLTSTASNVNVEKIALPVIERDVSSSSESSSDEDDNVPPPPKIPRQSTKPIGMNQQRPSNDDDNEDNLVWRKKSKTFLENGRLKIDRLASAGNAIHVIDKTIKRTKEFDDDKAKEADNRRMKSLKNMKNLYDQQKLAIKNALKTDTNTGKSKKIIFSDDEPVDGGGKQKKPKLFNDNDNDDDEEDFDSKFAVRKEYEGVGGAKLQQLNARYKNDNRFQMDASFLPEDDAVAIKDHQATTKNSEREWQYGILEGIIGHELHSKNPGGTKEKNRMPSVMQRYDPTNVEHTKFLAKNTQKQSDLIPAVNDVPIITDDTGINVSKEQFYKTSELSSSLWSKSTGFSLLSMFGHSNNDDEKSTVTKSTESSNKIKDFTKKKNTKLMNDMTNPFEYDSSDDDQQFLTNSVKAPKTIAKKSEIKSKTNKIQTERFFFTADDDRLKDGLSFFVSSASMQPQIMDEDEQELRHKQQQMRNIIKKKIKRSIRSKLPHGAKPNRHFRRFTRNL